MHQLVSVSIEDYKLFIEKAWFADYLMHTDKKLLEENVKADIYHTYYILPSLIELKGITANESHVIVSFRVVNQKRALSFYHYLKSRGQLIDEHGEPK